MRRSHAGGPAPDGDRIDRPHDLGGARGIRIARGSGAQPSSYGPAGPGNGRTRPRTDSRAASMTARLRTRGGGGPPAAPAGGGAGGAAPPGPAGGKGGGGPPPH